MTRVRLTVAAAAAAIAAAALLLGGAFRSSSAVDSAQPAAAATAAPSLALGDTAALVHRLQHQLRTKPSAQAFAALGFAYEQRARETGDPGYYSKADGVLRRSLALAPRNAPAIAGLGSLALSRHRFRDALRLGRKAHELAPQEARYYGVVGDALVELGRYRDAFAAFDMLAREKPGLAAYSRVSYARELLGDIPGSIRAMRLAIDTAAGQPESMAWTRVQLGKLYWATGRLSAARRQFATAVSVFPGYVYGLDALAQVEAARGRLGRAIRLETQAANDVPLPQFVSYLGDLYRASRQPGLAAKQYGLMAVIRRLLAVNGVKTDLETALFQVDHGIRLPQALSLARLAQRQRPSIDGDDVLAWALARNGRCDEALHYSRLALRLGTRDALKFFHRGMIERCLGDGPAARSWFGRALALNPHFSFRWAPVARKALR
jgi:tetratricopeptide (TPR) repeat protein